MIITAMDNQVENYQEIEADEVHFLESIGKGSFGVVYKALWRGLTVAVKKVETESEVNAFYNEVQQLARVQHENIIYLYGACVSDIHKCLVIEFADGGSLYHLLHNSPNTEYNLAHGISWLLQCARAVSYLHAIQPRPLLHRDLKPPNLLLTKEAKILKVCDFGTACELSTIMSDNRGSAAWMAPEVFEGKLYTEKCDVYSWGIILWEVMTRRVPFEDLGLAVRIMWAVHQKQRPPLVTGCPKLLENLMKRCWDHNQARRPRMEEVVEKISFIVRFLKGADEPINNPPSDDSMTDSYRSPCIGSSAGHTSRDVSEFTCSTNDITSDPCGHGKIQTNNIGLSTLHNEDASTWGSSGSEGTYPVRDTGDGCSPPQGPPAPAISPNVSSTVVVTGEMGSPWSTAPSDDLEKHMLPLAITIPNAEPPPRSDIIFAPPRAPTISLQPSVNVPAPIGSIEGISPSAVPMRQHLTPSDPNAHLRRRSAEVTPQPTSYREGGHHDPSMRAPGGSLGGVESALRFPDMPLPPTPTPSPGPTPTLSPAPTSSAIPSWLPYTLYGPEPGGGSHNGEGGGGGTEGGGGGTDEEELGAFWDLLDNEIRPIKPLPSCPESQKIFSEHKEMARKYLVLQQEIFNLRKRKSVLENKLSQAEKLEQIGNQRYQDKIRELESKRENLRHTHSRLRQQLEQIRTRQEQQQKRQQQQDDGNGGDLDHHLPLAPP
ncbi:mitogen-activated protein kinase kinase kinase 7-like isoform X2 [Homarus americanus]|uniref:mitogen-activated protein kinase kinase kinase 7-like isoform X2 n=1 Tax=Homarus americanus TaxID=6706 RepID=UPI001C48B27B|nr:mitogen-activated protein kinase kinase kinase 7-like isoform X2 [Homarus americanus]